MNLLVLLASVLFNLYVGTYGDAIHVLSYDPETCAMEEVNTIPAFNASYIAFGDLNSNGEKTLFSVKERGSESGVYSFARKADGWHQTAYFQQTGADPSYILPISGRDLVVTADYTGASFSVFGTKDGVITGRVQQVVKEGGHDHQVKEIPASICRSNRINGRYVLVTDLGNDEIRIEQIDGKKGLKNRGMLHCGKGAGPRHMEFNEEKSLLYCLTELSGEVIVCRIGCKGGVPTLTEVQRIMADGFNGGGSADIHLHPSGKWLYTSHRLKGDGISVMKVEADGLIEKTSYVPTGIHPRNFTFSPDGKRVIVANRDSKSIQVFDINETDGSLVNTGIEYVFTDDMPVCLVFGDTDIEKPCARELIRADYRRAADMHYTYGAPSFIADTPAPEGYTAFYITHYGRHGSRYHWGMPPLTDVLPLIDTLDKNGLFSTEGKEVAETIRRINSCHDGQVGILTQKGGLEHQGISQRMYARFPEVFAQKDRINVRCESTAVPRCIQSMGNFAMILKDNAPQLSINLYAGDRFGAYLNKKSKGGVSREEYRILYQILEDNLDSGRIAKAWFTDAARAQEVLGKVSMDRFVYLVFSGGHIGQCLDEDNVDIFHFFTEDELYALWLTDNAYCYTSLHMSQENGDRYLGTGQAILEDFVRKADLAVAGNDRAADLRFGHDTALLPFISVLGAEGDDIIYHMAEASEKGWYGFQHICMATNIQMVFYRNASGEVLVKILHNEREKVIPSLSTVNGVYHRWPELRAYFEQRLAL